MASIEDEIREQTAYLERLKSARDTMEPGVTSFNVHGTTVNFNRAQLLNEIVAVENRLEKLKMAGESRVIDIRFG